MSCIIDSDSINLTVTAGVLEADLILDPDPANAATVGSAGLFVSGPNESGWFSADETWTYASADAPTFTFTLVGDGTAKYQAGQRIKLTQTMIRYFIITGVSYNSGTGLTTVTVYGGTDYTLANAAITSPFYSTSKVPLGFPTDPTKWTVEFTDTGAYLQNSPAQNTWYNLGSKSLTVPIGVWDLDFEVEGRCTVGASAVGDVQVCLSAANNSATDQRLVSATNGYVTIQACARRKRTVQIAGKTVYYLNIRTTSTPMNDLQIKGDDATTVLRAVCSYL